MTMALLQAVNMKIDRDCHSPLLALSDQSQKGFWNLPGAEFATLFNPSQRERHDLDYEIPNAGATPLDSFEITEDFKATQSPE
jgi:hypothetical protein